MSGAMATTRAAVPARAWLPWAALLLALLALFHETGASMVAIWIRSETYTHAFLVPVISAWLAWRRRDQLAGMPIRPVPWLLAPIALVCLAWLAGELAAVQSATHFALVTLVVLSVPAVLGWAVARALTFPLLFLFFAVPFGEFMVPQLMEWTADFTVLALQWTGIPVYRDGLQFVIPSGHWSVVEACSGIRYLIASFMVGSLFAYLNYRSPWRRAAFIGVSLLVPLLANWVRAYMIVMIGHLSNNKLAAGVDHLIYGWVFFGVVIALMFLIGARWAEAEAEAKGAGPANSTHRGSVARPAIGRGWTMVFGTLGLALAAQGYQWHLDRGLPDRKTTLTLPDRVGQDWQARSEPTIDWEPAFAPPSARATGIYGRNGRVVWVWLALYRSQGGERKLVSSTNVLVDGKNHYWAQARAGQTRSTLDDRTIEWRTAELRDADPLAQRRGLVVWQTYWVGGRWLAGDAQAKLWAAWDRLLGRGDDGAVLMVYTEPGPGAADAMADLARGLLPPLDAMLKAGAASH